MMKNLVLTHRSGIKFVYENFSSESNLTEIWRIFQKENNVMSLKSFYNLVNNFGIVKGWTAIVENPVTSKIQQLDRGVAQREEKRSQRKLDKKAKKMAERSLKNGSRAFMDLKQKEEEAGKMFKTNPLVGVLYSKFDEA